MFHFPCFLTFTRGSSVCFYCYSCTDTGKITIAEVLFLSMGVERNLYSFEAWRVCVFSIADTSIYSPACFHTASYECYYYVLNEEERSNWPKATNSLCRKFFHFRLIVPHSWHLIDSRIICTHTERQTHILQTNMRVNRASTSKDVNNSLLGIIHGHQSIRMCAFYWFFSFAVLP